MSIRVVLLLLCGLLGFFNAAEAMTFRFSSIGYHPEAAKVAVLEDVPVEQDVKVVLFDPTRRNPRLPVFLGATVYEFKNPRVFRDKVQQGPITKDLLLDFSEFKETGTYEFRIEGTEIKSEPVRITEFIYWDTLKPVVKSFYFQRCGQEVEDRGLKVFHSACHLQDATFNNPERKSFYGEDSQDVVGGWHNGSDYAKYTTSTALSAAKLIAMHEMDPKPFKYFRLDYPLFEPGYGTIDDLHHEIQAGLDWLMVMQRRDGGLYRKVAGKQWPGTVSPDHDEQERYIFGLSTTDTANAAATWAMAARDFKEIDLGYSVKSLLAAKKAWSYLENHPDLMLERSTDDFSGSGEFIHPTLKTDTANRLWAAAELYLATGQEKYHRYFLDHLDDVPLQPFSWYNPALLGMSDYVLYAANPNPQAVLQIKRQILGMAERIEKDIRSDLWPSGLQQFEKASNRELVERAAVLMLAHQLSGKAHSHYRDSASRMVSYLFGVNPLGMTYVTGLNGKAVAHPYHRWMQATDKLIPGYLVDGPNAQPTDLKVPKGLGPYSYVDEPVASVNESTLLNNAGLAYVLTALNNSYNIGQNEDKQETLPSPLDFELAPERPKAKSKSK